jgi:hypothetical protein
MLDFLEETCFAGRLDLALLSGKLAGLEISPQRMLLFI